MSCKAEALIRKDKWYQTGISRLKTLCLIIAITLLGSCATHRVKISDTDRDWRTNALPDKSLSTKVYLIGDTGFGKNDELSETLQLLGRELKTAPANSAVVFLGNNASSKGLPPKSHPKRQRAERRLQAQLELVKDFKGKVFFLPGEEDWSDDKVEAVRRQEKFIEEYLGRGNTFIPNNGCGGPEAEDLSDNTVLVAVDSHWWLTNWDEEPDINEKCEYRTRRSFMFEVEDKFKDHRDKNIIFVMHHPIETNGRYGGYYSAKEHLFPLTMVNPKLYLPLPVIGSVATFLKNNIATSKKPTHPKYEELRDEVVDLAEQYTSAIFVGAHDRNLQYFQDDEQHFIVSGAGVSGTPVALSDDASFVYGGQGYSVLNIFEDGEVWLEFWRPGPASFLEGIPPVIGSENIISDAGPGTSAEPQPLTVKPVSNQIGSAQLSVSPELLFRKKIKDPLPTVEEQTPDVFPEYEQLSDSVVSSILKPGDIKTYNKKLWGTLHTDLYFKEFKVPVLDLAEWDGGAVAYKRGGGFQTNSIRLQAEDGHIWQLRSLRKRTDKLPGILGKTFAVNIFEHQLTAGNPFGAILLTPMADAIDIYHTNPKIFYVPKQPNLNKYNDFAGELFLLEERPDDDAWSDLEDFGYSKEIESSNKLWEEIQESDEAVIDQPLVLRSRLFDMLIGDWDRHKDQWRWATFEVEGSDKTLYRPIPRDRDQPFPRYDGWIPAYMKMVVPFFRASRNFDDKIGDWENRWLNFQARNFDRYYMNQLTWPQWEEQVKYIQEHLTDEIIEDAFRSLPPNVYEEFGEDYTRFTKQRRDDLMHTARTYYKFLYKKVTVYGTHQKNLFEIERMPNGHTRVIAYEYDKDGEGKDKLYEREFDPKITKEIIIHGLDKADDFIVEGRAKNAITLRLIGGPGKDTFVDNSVISDWQKKTLVYDDLQPENKLKLGKEGKDMRTARRDVNTMPFSEMQYNYFYPVPFVGFNPDDGLFVGANVHGKTYGFKSSATHKFMGRYAFATNAFTVGYEGTFFNSFDKWDLTLNARLDAPQYTFNFHGLGNETVRNTDEAPGGKNFYRIREASLNLEPSLQRRFWNGAKFAFGPSLQTVRIEDTPDRVVSREDMGIRSEVFDWQYFAGANLAFDYKNADSNRFPTQGLSFSLLGDWRQNLLDLDRRLLRLKSDLSMYIRLSSEGSLVLATRLGVEHIIGDYDFFQSAFIGGRGSLRGFSVERFAGRSTLYHNLDLRIKIIKSKNNSLPFSLGITPGFDYGRVWIDEETSEKWHTSYGGTVWIAPLDYIALSGGAFLSEEGTRFTFMVGFQF